MFATKTFDDEETLAAAAATVSLDDHSEITVAEIDSVLEEDEARFEHGRLPCEHVAQYVAGALDDAGQLRRFVRDCQLRVLRVFAFDASSARNQERLGRALEALLEVARAGFAPLAFDALTDVLHALAEHTSHWAYFDDHDNVMLSAFVRANGLRALYEALTRADDKDGATTRATLDAALTLLNELLVAATRRFGYEAEQFAAALRAEFGTVDALALLETKCPHLLPLVSPKVEEETTTTHRHCQRYFEQRAAFAGRCARGGRGTLSALGLRAESS
jgi:hypothetical protein